MHLEEGVVPEEAGVGNKGQLCLWGDDVVLGVCGPGVMWGCSEGRPLVRVMTEHIRWDLASDHTILQQVAKGLPLFL